jgi:hypothetical protein
VARHPELESVALLPIQPAGRVVGERQWRIDLPAACLINPIGRQQLLAIPTAALQVQLAESSDRIRRGEQSAEADVAACRVLLPADFADAQRIQQSRAQIVNK